LIDRPLSFFKTELVQGSEESESEENNGPRDKENNGPRDDENNEPRDKENNKSSDDDTPKSCQCTLS
jgi:hypothetical protein